MVEVELTLDLGRAAGIMTHDVVDGEAIVAIIRMCATIANEPATYVKVIIS